MEPYAKGFTHPFFKPINFRDYRNYLPTAYDNSLDMYQQMTQVLQFCNEIGILNQDMSNNWNMLLSWIETNGVDEAVTALLSQWVVDGTMAKILDKTALKDINKKLDDLIAKENEDVIATKKYAKDLFDTATKSYQQLFLQLDNKVDRNYNTLIEMIKGVGTGVKGTYNTVEELQTAHPTGDNGNIYVVTAGEQSDWYYFDVETSKWVKGGVFIKGGIPANGISAQQLKWNVPYAVIVQNENFVYDATTGILTTGTSGASVILSHLRYGTIPANQHFGVGPAEGSRITYLGYSSKDQVITGYTDPNTIPDDSAFLGSIALDGQGKPHFATHFNCVPIENVNAYGNRYPINRGDVVASISNAHMFGVLTLDPVAKTATALSTVSMIINELAYGTLTAGTVIDLKDQIADNQNVIYVYWHINADKKPTLVTLSSYQHDNENDVYIGRVEKQGDFYKVTKDSWSALYTSEYLIGAGAYNVTSRDVMPKGAPAQYATGCTMTIDVTARTLSFSDSWGSAFSANRAYGNPFKGVVELKVADSPTATGFFLFWNNPESKINVYTTPTKAKEQDMYFGFVSLSGEVIYDLPDKKVVIEHGGGSSIANQWQNKKLLAFGDSITAGADGTGALDPKISWVSYMQSICGFGSVDNKGISGAHICHMEGKTDGAIDRYKNYSGYDCIAFFMGVNDIDFTNTPNEVESALDVIFAGLLAQNPNCKLSVITPMKEEKFVPYDTKNDRGFYPKDYVEVIKKTADKYSLPLLDMYSYGNIGVRTPEMQGVDGYTIDKLHPTAKGYKKIATQIGSFLNSL